MYLLVTINRRTGKVSDTKAIWYIQQEILWSQKLKFHKPVVLFRFLANLYCKYKSYRVSCKQKFLRKHNICTCIRILTIMFAGSSSRKEEKRGKGGARKNVERERRKCSQEITSIDFLNLSVLLIKICYFKSQCHKTYSFWINRHWFYCICKFLMNFFRPYFIKL